MKNKFYAFATLLLSVVFYTQAQGSGDIRFGAKAGFNMSTLGGDANYSYDAKPGFHLGGVVEIPVSDKLLIQPEALISLQGSGGFFQDDLNFWYLNVPVMAKYNIWDKLFIEAGPQVSLLLSDNLDGNLYGGNTQIGFESNGLDFGFGAGAGYRLDDNFYFQLRINTGFINALKNTSSKNRTFQISAVYFL